MFHLYDTVRVVRLLVPRRHAMGSFEPAPQPAVGDEGTVVDVVESQVTVEQALPDGRTRWLASFASEELALVARARDPRLTSEFPV